MAAADRSRVRACRPKVRWPASAKAVHACPTAGAAVVAGGRCKRALARNPRSMGVTLAKRPNTIASKARPTLRAAPRAVPMWYVVQVRPELMLECSPLVNLPVLTPSEESDCRRGARARQVRQISRQLACEANWIQVCLEGAACQAL